MLPLFKNENVKVLNLVRKKPHTGVPKIYSKNKSSLHETVNKEKEMYAGPAVKPHPAGVIATVSKCSVKMEKCFKSVGGRHGILAP